MLTFRNPYQINHKINRCFKYKNVHETSLTIDQLSLFYVIKKDISLKALIRVASLLEIITGHRAFFIRSRKSSVFLKVRKGAPLGVKVTLRKESVFLFLIKLVWQIFPNIKKIRFKTKLAKVKQEKINSLMYVIFDPLVFQELKNFYFLFKSCVNLRILLSFSKNLNKKELFLNTRFLQLPS
jgi:hypothetical protein